MNKENFVKKKKWNLGLYKNDRTHRITRRKQQFMILINMMIIFILETKISYELKREYPYY